MTVSQLSAIFQARLVEIQEKIKRTVLPQAIQEPLINDVRKMGQDFNEKQRLLQQNHDRERENRDQLQSDLDEAYRQLRDAIADRDRAFMERDALRSKIDDLRLKHKKSVERVEKIGQHWKQVSDDYMKQISAQEEQLKGKRALWLESNPGSSARRSAMNAIRDPFNSPSASHTSAFGGGNTSKVDSMGNVCSTTSPSLQGSFGPSPFQAPTGPAHRGPRRRPNLPVNRAQPGVESAPVPWGGASTKIYDTRPGDTPINPLYKPSAAPTPAVPTSTALVLHTNNEDRAPEYQAAFSKIYALVEGWVKTYSNVPNLENDQAITRSNETLWAYMMNCTYPDHRQDSHTHVMALLQDAKTRYWFVMRMAITYCVKDIMSIEVFKKYSTAVEVTINDCKKKLEERGMLLWFPISSNLLTCKSQVLPTTLAKQSLMHNQELCSQ
jgi:hypothetical protein